MPVLIAPLVMTAAEQMKFRKTYQLLEQGETDYKQNSLAVARALKIVLDTRLFSFVHFDLRFHLREATLMEVYAVVYALVDPAKDDQVVIVPISENQPAR